MTVCTDPLVDVAARASSVAQFDSAAVLQFLESRRMPDGGFRGRGVSADLFYTHFAVLTLLALGRDFDSASLASYVKPFRAVESLDLVHTVSLLRLSRLADTEGTGEELARTLTDRVSSFRRSDGGYAMVQNAACGTPYGAFMAMQAYRVVGGTYPDAGAVHRSLESMSTPDGGYANSPGGHWGSTPATAAAVAVLSETGGTVPGAALDWLAARQDGTGGFRASSLIPMADLLSTATAVYALHGAGGVLSASGAESCRQYVAGLRRPCGGYSGHAMDTTADPEYTFYACLASGGLA